MRLARGGSAIPGGAGICQPFTFFCRIHSGNHFSEEVPDIETRSLHIAQLVGEQKIEYRAVFIVVRQTRNSFIRNCRAGRVGLRRDSFSRGLVPGLLQISALQTHDFVQTRGLVKSRVSRSHQGSSHDDEDIWRDGGAGFGASVDELFDLITLRGNFLIEFQH